jgi:hypothetical protein
MTPEGIAVNDTAPSRNADTPLDENTRLSLDIAKRLAVAGVPIFLAEPGGDPVVGYQLPNDWQHTVPDPTVIDRWRPGMALCAVGGHEVDFIDVDPRNGGDETERVMRDNGSWPRTFGTADSPSGGRHYVITPLRVGKYQGKGTLTGIDVQGGRPDGTGRGFVFLAPTVRRSKTDGVPRAYRWVIPPNLDELAEWSAAGDDSGVMLADMIRGAQNATEDRPAAATSSPVDPFDPPPRIFTMDQAKEFIRPQLEAFRAMRTPEDSGFNDALNKLACLYSHFIPAFVSRESAERTLFEAAAANRSVEFQGERKVRATIRSGLDQKHDPWKAHLPADRAAAGPTEGDGPAAPDQAAPSVDPRTRADRIRALFYVRSELDAIPVPEPLITGVLDRGTIAVLAGKFGTYKSFVALSWLAALATGQDWFGHKVPATVSGLYVAAEGLSGVSRRVRAWEAGNNGGDRLPDDRFAVVGGAINLAVGEDVRTLIAMIEERGAGIVALDTLHRCAPGLEENSAKDMGVVIESLSYIRERTGAAVLAMHHTGHSGTRARGSSAIEDDCDTSWVIRLAEDDGEDRSAANPRTMYHRKTKDGELSGDIPLELIMVGDDAYVGRCEPGDGFDTGGSVWLGARAIAMIMDEMDLPAATGKRKAAPLLREAGHKIRNDQLEEALRLRKSGKEYRLLPGLVPVPGVGAP